MFGQLCVVEDDFFDFAVTDGAELVCTLAGVVAEAPALDELPADIVFVT